MYGDFAFGPIGFDYLAHKEIFLENTGLIGAYYTNAWEHERGSDWMQNVTRHLDYEKSFEGNRMSSKVGKGIDFWPDYNQTCSRNFAVNEKCVTG